jgi:hypothetical protein
MMKLIYTLIIPLPLAAGGGTLNRDNGLMLFLIILAILVTVAGINYIFEIRHRIIHFIRSLFHRKNNDPAAPVE